MIRDMTSVADRASSWDMNGTLLEWNLSENSNLQSVLLYVSWLLWFVDSEHENMYVHLLNVVQVCAQTCTDVLYKSTLLFALVMRAKMPQHASRC